MKKLNNVQVPRQTPKGTFGKSEREKLIEEFQPLVGGQREYAERAADHLIADRKRVVEHLVKVESELIANEANVKNIYVCATQRKKAIDETLKRAGSPPVIIKLKPSVKNPKGVPEVADVKEPK